MLKILKEPLSHSQSSLISTVGAGREEDLQFALIKTSTFS